MLGLTCTQSNLERYLWRLRSSANHGNVRVSSFELRSASDRPSGHWSSVTGSDGDAMLERGSLELARERSPVRSEMRSLSTMTP
jgi:hypothetical protein